jgi:cytoskeletal protein CcmA (bactofilin family)
MESRTVLGPATRWRGEMDCEAELQIDGSFEGSIRQRNGTLIIGKEAKVRARIVAENVCVAGHLEGDLYASERVHLRESAVVVGNIFTAKFSMEDSAALQGRVDQFSASGSVETPLRAKEVTLTLAAAQASPSSASNMKAPTVPRNEGLSVPPGITSSLAERKPDVQQPPVLATHSGRQLPSALAAFAAGGRQARAVEDVLEAQRAEQARWSREDRQE